MMSLTCHDITPEFARRWLDKQLNRDEQDAVQTHLRGCLTCTRTLSKTVSGHLFDFLTGKGQDLVPSFMNEVSELLKGPASETKEPLSATFQRMVALTRDVLWSVFSPIPTPHLDLAGTMNASTSPVLEEEGATGTKAGTSVVLTEKEHVHAGPLLTGSGRFQLVLHGPESRLVGKDLCCDLQLIEGQTISFRTPIHALSDASGWEAKFDELLLTDASLYSTQDYRIPFRPDYLRFIVRPSHH